MLTKGKMTMSSCLSFIPYYPRTIFGGVFPCNAATKFSAAVIAICCLVFNVADPMCGKVTTFCNDKSGLSFESALV